MPNASQSEIIKSFETIARQTNQEDKILDFPFIDHGQPLNEFDSTEQVFVNAYPWLFPGGIGDVYDPRRGKRHTNNSQGNFFYKDKNFLGAYGGNPPTVEDLQQQLREGNMSYINKLRYLAKGIRGSDSFWRGKTEELEAWIDFHISRGNGPPTHFVTLSCAENWWPDLRRLLIQLEIEGGNVSQARLLEENDRPSGPRSEWSATCNFGVPE
eukprot:scaffold4204_cov178-Skeletonema_marinoi.AAC.1